jgi:hypothetical protein
MNAYQEAIQRLASREECDIDVLKELRATRNTREEVRPRSHEDWMSKLPYSSKPDFLGERWKT